MPKKGVTFKLKGLREIERNFKKAIRRIGATTTEAMTDVVLDLTGEAAAQALVDTGALRGSGFGSVNETVVAKGNKDGGINTVGKAPEGKTQVTGHVGFSEIYAAPQHELKQNHPKGGKDKYLEDPLKANIKRYIQRLGEGVKKGCKS